MIQSSSYPEPVVASRTDEEYEELFRETLARWDSERPTNSPNKKN